MSPQPNSPPSPPIEIFTGRTNPAVAEIYVRWYGPCDAGCQLSGTWRGPACRHAHCLPFSAQFTDQGPGPAPLAKVTVPDPCFWTPDCPALYQLEMELRDERGRVKETARQMFGLRPMVARGRNLVREGKRVVLRGVGASEAIDTDTQFTTARELRAALIVTNPDAAYCQVASQEGVILLARPGGPRDTLDKALRRLSPWPAVAVILLRDPRPKLPLSRLAPQVLIGQEIIRPGDETVADWADLVVCHLLRRAEKAEISWMRDLEIPCMALRAGPTDEIAAGRRACDALQRELAGQIELAGYLIGR